MKLIVDVADKFAATVVRAIRELGIIAEVDVLDAIVPVVVPPVVEPVKVSSKLANMLGETDNMTDAELATLMARSGPLQTPGTRTLGTDVGRNIPDVHRVGSGATSAAAQVRSTRGNGRAKIYTPAKTKREMNAALAKLRDGTLQAYVLGDIIANGESRNADIRARLSKDRNFAKSGLSIESVDNIIWKFVNDGLLAKHDAE